jgi:hypothetical protein
MDLTTGASLRIAVLAHFRFAFAVGLDVRAVHDQTQSSLRDVTGSATVISFGRLLSVVSHRGFLRS